MLIIEFPLPSHPKKLAQEKNKKEKQLILQLKSKDDQEVLSAIKAIQNHGTLQSVEPLLNTWNQDRSEAINTKIHELFATLKISGSQPIIIDKLLDDDFQNIHQYLLNALWQSGIDYTEYIPSLAKKAVRGNYMEAFECVTIIENLENQPDETHIMDAIWVIKNNRDQVNETAKPMVDELETLLKSIDNKL